MTSNPYPPETLHVNRTSYANGITIDYGKSGRPQYHLLPSNHPLVLAEAELRKPIRNTFKKPETLVQQAGVIIQLTSEKIRRAKG